MLSNLRINSLGVLPVPHAHLCLVHDLDVLGGNLASLWGFELNCLPSSFFSI